jgi:leucyl aminopeptidase (aminopeptidase T)
MARDVVGKRRVLEQVAGRVVTDYLCTAPGENFLLVTDRSVPVVLSRALLAAAVNAGVDPTHVELEVRSRSGEEPPAVAEAAMIAADVCLCIASKSIYHTNAKGRAQASGTRGCFNAPVTLSAWTSGAMTANFQEIRPLAERLADRLRGARFVRVTSPAGTNISMGITGREPRGWHTGIVQNAGEISAFPGGEVSLPPVEGTSNGVMVFECVMTDIGTLAAPIRVGVVDGLAVTFEGGEEADRLRELVEGVPGATNIGELGIGLNPAAPLNDDITESKKRLGTAHMALGDNAGGYGGVVESPLHLDGMMLKPSVWIDDEPVISDGEMLI